MLPPSLYKRQKWFAEKISSVQFLQEDELTPGCERLEIYHALYWNRLFRYFFRTFPFLTRLFSEKGMKQEILIPYLLTERPEQSSLTLVGQGLLLWLQEKYVRSDRQFILLAAQLDWVHEALFLAPQLPFPKGNSHEILSLQPYVELFAFQGDLVDLRAQFMEQEADYWETHPFPKWDYENSYYYLIFYSRKEGLVYQKICSRQYAFLCSIKSQKSLEQIVKDIDPETQNDWLQWIYTWAHQGFLSGHEVV